MMENNNELSEQEIEMIKRSLLCVIPDLSKLSSVSMSTVNGRMKFVCDGGKNVLNIPNSVNIDKTTSDRDTEMRMSSSAGNAIGLTSETSFLPSPVSSCRASDISLSNDQTGSAISVSNHKKTIRSKTTGQVQAESLQILSSLEVRHQNLISFEDKGTGNVRPKRKSMDRDFAESYLKSNKKHAPSLVSLGFDRPVSGPDIFMSSSVVGSQVINPAQIQSWDKVKRSNPLLSHLLHTDIPDEMPRPLDTGNVLPVVNRDNQSTSEGIESSLMSSAQIDAAPIEAESLNVNLINEIPDVVQSKSICTEENCNNEDVSVKMISSKNGEEIIQHLDQQSVEDFQKSSPTVSACYEEAAGEDQQQSGRGFVSSTDDVLRSANDNLLISSQSNVPEKTTAADLQSNGNEDSGCLTAVSCEKTSSGDLCASSSNCLSLSAAVVSSSQSLETFCPKAIASHELSGASTVQRYMAASVQFLGGARSPGNNSLLPSPQANSLGDIRYCLLQEDTQLRSESVNVDALFPKGRSLHRTFTSPKNHRKLNNQESPMLNVSDVLGLEESSKPINREKLSFETEGGSFDPCVDALFRKPRMCRKSSNSRKRKLFFSSEQPQLKLFSNKLEKTFIKSGTCAPADRRALKEDDRFRECPADDDARLPHCTDSNCESRDLSSDNISSELFESDKNITKCDQKFKIYGNMIRGIHQQRKDCKKAANCEVSPKENDNSNKDESRIDGSAVLCEKQLREEKDLNLASEIKNSQICLSLAKNKIPFEDSSHEISLKECQQQPAGRINTQKYLLTKQNFSLAFKSHILKMPAVAAFLLSRNSELQGKNDQLNHQTQKSSLMLNVKESIRPIEEGHGNHLDSDQLRSRSRMRESKSSLTSTGQFISSCNGKYETQNTEFSANKSSLSSENEVHLLPDCDIDRSAKQKDKKILGKRHKLKQNASICSHTESRIVKNRISNKLCHKHSSNSEFHKQLEHCRASSSDVKGSSSSVVHREHKRSERKTTGNLGLGTAVNPSHKSNLSSVHRSDALKTKTQEKLSAVSCSKIPLREKTASNQLFCSDYAHTKKMKELLKREVGSSSKIKNVRLK